MSDAPIENAQDLASYSMKRLTLVYLLRRCKHGFVRKGEAADTADLKPSLIEAIRSAVNPKCGDSIYSRIPVDASALSNSPFVFRCTYHFVIDTWQPATRSHEEWLKLKTAEREALTF
jgi:hypothetical protein